MSEPTKACNLTKEEIKKLIAWHGSLMSLEGQEEHIERINYLNKRLKSFNEVEIVKEEIETKPEIKDGW